MFQYKAKLLYTIGILSQILCGNFVVWMCDITMLYIYTADNIHLFTIRGFFVNFLDFPENVI